MTYHDYYQGNSVNKLVLSKAAFCKNAYILKMTKVFTDVQKGSISVSEKIRQSP